MKQSERIRMFKNYCNHPLQEEYEKKRKKICKNKPKSTRLIYAGLIFSIVMFFVYDFIVCNIDTNVVASTVIVILLGIVNLILGFLLLYFSLSKAVELNEKYSKKELDALNKEYQEKGLIFITENDLYNSPCGEYDSYDDKVCSVTKQRLSSRDYDWCHHSGNCRHCRTFMSCVISPDFVKDEEQSNSNWYKR